MLQKPDQSYLLQLEWPKKLNESHVQKSFQDFQSTSSIYTSSQSQPSHT